MLVIEKKDLNSWAQSLRKKYAVFAPQKNGLDVAFKKVGDKSKIMLGYKRTLMPIKEFFLPAKEITFLYDNKKKKLSSSPVPKKFILFGLNYPDLEASAYLDEIMSKPAKDFFYWQKRKKSILVGLINKTISTYPGGDIILQKINLNQYRAVVITDKGRKITKSNLFKELKNPKIKRYDVKMPRLRQLISDSELIAEAVAWSWKNYSEIWDDLSKTCLGCGICAYVCPLCFCFSTEDRISLDNKECNRCRYWDACTLPGFSAVAGGHNFHGTLKERYYNWFYHKFVRGYKEYGRSLCVACSRCQKYCPAGIDIEKVLGSILKNYLTKNK